LTVFWCDPARSAVARYHRFKARQAPSDTWTVDRRAAPDAPAALLSVEETARLVVLWRLAAGAAHSLNNALTAILGEASFLADDHKDDPAVVEGCAAIIAEVDRCARLTRAVLARRHPAQGRSAEVDLVRLVGDLGRMLHETLGRRIELELALPDDLLVVAGDAAALELLCLALVHFASDLQPGGARLRVGVEAGPGSAEISLSFAVHATGLPEGAARRVLEPGAVASPLERLSLEAAHRVAASHGARIASSEAPGRLEVLVRFPACDER
jgi:two-component system NtrC family sensor kinase